MYVYMNLIDWYFFSDTLKHKHVGPPVLGSILLNVDPIYNESAIVTFFFVRIVRKDEWHIFARNSNADVRLFFKNPFAAM